MWQVLEKEIERKARAILAKQRRAQAGAEKYASRFTTRTGQPSIAAPYRRPPYWDYDNQFDPVYCISHARFLAKRIWSKINSDLYEPKPAVLFEIPKPDGGTRDIMLFSIPDSAVANIFHRRLTARNKGMFSAYSFAYRPDKNVFEAIVHLQRMLQPSKTYILKYDYSKYFDTIDHVYLRKLFERQSFSITSAERKIIDAFLGHRYAAYPSWQTMNYSKRKIGVPQGSSLSLFLSNIAAHDLDITLERLDGSFVRFADDVIAIAHSYSDARDIELEFRAHCERSGVKINFEKSSGITLLQGRASDDRRDFFLDKDDGGVIHTKEFIDFLGHRVSSRDIDITDRAVKRIKRKISRIIYIHLLLYPRRSHQISISRVGTQFTDWDLVTCINELRRYIYGGLREVSLTNFIDADVKLPYVRGLMDFYALVSRVDRLAQLDGWLVNVLQRAVRERQKIIVAQGLPGYGITKESIISGDWHISEVNNETSLPSFVRGWRAARKLYRRYGLSEVQAPSYYSLLSLY
jgi:hypothetical protein